MSVVQVMVAVEPEPVATMVEITGGTGGGGGGVTGTVSYTGWTQ